jgi:hypothetical protein
MQEFGIQRFILRTVNDVEVKEQCQVTISDRFAALENLGGGGGGGDDDDDVDISRAWQSVKREYKSFSHEECRLL